MTFRTTELERRLKGRELRQGQRFDDVVVIEIAHQRRHAVIAQAAGMHRCGDKIAAQGVHLNQGRETNRVAKIISIRPFSQGWTGGGFDGDNP